MTTKDKEEEVVNPGDAVMAAAAAERETRQPNVRDFQRLVAWTAENATELIDREPSVWVALRLAIHGAEFTYKDGKSAVVTAMTCSWEALDAVWEEVARRVREAGEVQVGKLVESFSMNQVANILAEEEIAQLVGENNIEWWHSLDAETQQQLADMTPEERLAHIELQAQLDQAADELQEALEDDPKPTVDDAKIIASAADVGTDERPITQSVREAIQRTEEGYIVSEDGEVLNPDTAFEVLEIKQRREQFRIESEEDLRWFGERVRLRQLAMQNWLDGVERRLKLEMSAYDALMKHYGPQVRDYLTKALPRYDKDSAPGAKNPHKAGELKSKSLKFEECGFYARGGGGSYVENRQDVMEFIKAELGCDPVEFLPEDLRAKYGLRLTLDFSKTKVCAAYDAGESIPGIGFRPIHEIEKVGIGGGGSKDRSAWNFDNVAKAFKRSVSTMAARLKGEVYTPSDHDDENED